MSLTCIIPARYHSTRFPGKLLAVAQGKTVLQRTFESALKCPLFNSVYVATDHEAIRNHILDLGGNVLWTSSNPINGTERLIEALRLYPSLQKTPYLFLLQGDHPCTSSKTLGAIASALIENPDAQVSTGVFPIQDPEEFFSPHTVKCVFTKAGKALYFSRSPIPYHREGNPLNAFGHLGIYCYRTNFLETYARVPTTPLQKEEDLEQLKILESGYHIQVARVDEKTPSVDIPSDLEKLEEYLCSRM
ncbi:MAG: 3-deoxy-manno-octulosonate cytidylyltransferase [Chlamydiae bacterium]|nr:3-deoxy-manno-octulosonate cytidylyltransferase [Chlamydiota bacterium]